MKEIHIDKPFISEMESGKSRLSCKITGMEKNPFILWYQVDQKYADKLCTERGDAFLVALLPHIMAHSDDSDPTKVYIEQPVSEKLYYYLTEIFLPSLAKYTDMYHTIELYTETTGDKLENEGAVATGISGGVDSFYTLVKHVGHSCKHYALSHGLYINLNAEGDNQVIFTRNDPEVICRKYGIDYMYLETNLLSLYRIVTDVTNIYMISSCALALQKLFSVYLVSSAYDYSHFEFDAHNASNYDFVSVNCLGTENLDFVLTGGEQLRVDKVKAIADDPVVKEHLFICSTPINNNNCSKCAKCTQTMLEYYVNGDRDKASKLFDWSYFDKNPNYYWGYIYRKGKYEHYDWPELQHRAKRNGLKVPFGAHLSGFIKFAKNGFRRITKAGQEYMP